MRGFNHATTGNGFVPTTQLAYTSKEYWGGEDDEAVESRVPFGFHCVSQTDARQLVVCGWLDPAVGEPEPDDQTEAESDGEPEPEPEDEEDFEATALRSYERLEETRTIDDDIEVVERVRNFTPRFRGVRNRVVNNSIRTWTRRLGRRLGERARGKTYLDGNGRDVVVPITAFIGGVPIPIR